ncbi:hypothetical protein VTN49DRAFT_3500 [Thermomyces lanuginosus]|uniref:uncharacterized protein n=1 Tax=Thermomyces lanuginosus TaxID=5541 RepID=UPI0037433EE4
MYFGLSFRDLHKPSARWSRCEYRRNRELFDNDRLGVEGRAPYRLHAGAMPRRMLMRRTPYPDWQLDTSVSRISAFVEYSRIIT